MRAFVPAAWLFDPVDVQEIESDWLDKPGPSGVPSHAWSELKAQMKPGDDLRAFSSPPKSLQNLAGRAGYALVRAGKAIDGIVTMRN
jgi:hypothetical protein